MNISELEKRLEVIYWVTNVALFSYERYKKILKNPEQLKLLIPNLKSSNPIIEHTIEGPETISFKTSKMEIVEEHNHNLYKAWQIVLGIVAMSSIIDFYLKQTTEKITGQKVSVMGIFDRFSKLTGIKITQLSGFEDLRRYHKVRDISLHNLGNTNEKFLNTIGKPKDSQGLYVYYPSDLKKYKDLIIKTVSYIERERDK